MSETTTALTAFLAQLNARQQPSAEIASADRMVLKRDGTTVPWHTGKITRAAARIKLGLQDKLYLGNLEARRDWGYAKEYVESMWLMLQHDEPDDFVIATGQTHSIRDFLDFSFGRLDLNWQDYV